jgi:hypothetical protein
MKRAQITMESLLLYGAAILVVLLAIAALTYFGVFDLGNLLPNKCDLSETSLFKCEEWQVDKSAKTVTIVVKNIAARPVDIDTSKLEFTSEGLVNNCLGPAGTSTLAPGKSSDPLVMTCTTMSSEAGDRVKGTVTISSKFADGGTLETITTGQLTAKVGP